MNANTKPIEYEFKILYAFSIIFIVMSHLYGGISVFSEYFPYASFAISPFLFASGYFYKEKYELNVKQYIIKKFKSLIIPLYLYNFCYGILVAILQNFGFYPNETVNLYNLLISPITNGLHFILMMGGWFIFPLFAVQVINILIRKLFRNYNIKVSEIVFFTYSLLLGLIGVILSMNNLNTGIFLVLDRILFFIPFFALGILYQKYKEYDKLNNIAYFSLIILVALVIIYFNGEMPFVNVNLAQLDTSFVLLPFIVGTLGTAFWLRISKILTPSIGNSKTINTIADNTYSIIINQFLGFKLVGFIFYLLWKYTPYCTNFNLESFKTVWDYYYLPHNLTQMYIIYIVAGIVIPIIIQKYITKLKKFLINIIHATI